MKNPKISIIIPVFNVGSYLRRCLDSILVQSHNDWECILIDDGSTDDSPALCDEYVAKDPRFFVIHKSNEGVSVARNVGLDFSHGEYVIFVDSDDWIEPQLVEILLRDADQYEILFYGHRNYYIDGDVVSYCPHERSCHGKNELENEIIHLKHNREKYEFFGYAWNKLFRLSVVNELGLRFVEKLKIREDELFTMEYCLHVNTLKVIDECLYNYRVYDTGLSTSDKTTEEVLLYAEKLRSLAEKWSLVDLRRLDFYRYSIFLHLASNLDKNVIRGVKLGYKAAIVSKANFQDRFQNLNKGIMKLPPIMSSLYHLFSCLKNKFL